MRQKLITIASIFLLPLVAISTANAQWVQTNGLYGENIQALALNGANIYAATSDSGVFLSTNNGMSWNAVNSGLTNKNVYALAVNGSYLFAGTYGSGVFRSTDSGTSWVPTNTGLTNTTLLSLLVNGTNLFAGTYNGGVFRSTDNGTSWTAMNSGITNNYVTSFVAMGTNLFAGTYGDVFLSSDDGISWNASLASISDVTALTVLGTNLFASVAGSGAYLSTNNGASWSCVSEDIPDIDLGMEPVTSFAVKGQNIFAGSGTAIGVFLSTNIGSSWNSVSTGLMTFVNNFAMSDTILFAGTWDSGVWRRPLSEMIPSSAVAERPTISPEIQTYPNPLTQSTKISFTLPESGEAEVTIVNLLGSEVARLFSGPLSAGEHSFEWDAGQAAAGTYFCALRTINSVQRVALAVER